MHGFHIVSRGIALVLTLVLALFAGLGANAQLLRPRFLLVPTAPFIPKDGTYTANDDLIFTTDHRDGQVRLRFSGNDEVFYLKSEAAPLSGRVLKYDSGAVALHVTGWGGVTVYTAETKNGLPTEYGDALENVDPPLVGPDDVKNFAARLADDLHARDDLIIGFVADWDELPDSEVLRALSCDAMRNAAYALKMVTKAGRRTALAGRVQIVRVIQGARTGVALQRGVLSITVAPKEGFSARPSSLAIARVVQAAL